LRVFGPGPTRIGVSSAQITGGLRARAGRDGLPLGPQTMFPVFGHQAEYSRNLLFHSGRWGDVFDTAVDRTRSRLDVPQVTTLFAAKTRPPTPGATCRPGWRSRSRHLRMT
jgi:hypothetical protein